MIELYYAATPEGQKITLLLEECSLPYRLHHIANRQVQFDPDFLALSPNNKIPAMVDHKPVNNGTAVTMFESGAILIYLSEKTGKFLSAEWRERAITLQWLFWQTSDFGPMLGQYHHFSQIAPQTLPYAIERFQLKTRHLYSVLNRQLEQHHWVAGGHFTIADMAIWPWVNTHGHQCIDLTLYPAVHNWFTRIQSRPATQRAMALALTT